MRGSFSGPASFGVVPLAPDIPGAHFFKTASTDNGLKKRVEVRKGSIFNLIIHRLFVIVTASIPFKPDR